jgi:hypothetical protein
VLAEGFQPSKYSYPAGKKTKKKVDPTIYCRLVLSSDMAHDMSRGIR